MTLSEKTDRRGGGRHHVVNSGLGLVSRQAVEERVTRGLEIELRPYFLHLGAELGQQARGARHLVQQQERLGRGALDFPDFGGFFGGRSAGGRAISFEADLVND